MVLRLTQGSSVSARPQPTDSELGPRYTHSNDSCLGASGHLRSRLFLVTSLPAWAWKTGPLERQPL